MKKAIVLVMALFVCAFTFADVRIGTFNARILADTKLSRPGVLQAMAAVLDQADVFAIQEVGSNGSKASLAECSRVIGLIVTEAKKSGEDWQFIVGDQYAFVWRGSKVSLLWHGQYSGAQRFTYSPLVARFKAGALTFVAMTVHTRPSEAKREIPSIPPAMVELASVDGNVICLGDYNADGAYYDPGKPGQGLRGFDGLVTVVKNGVNTTVSERNSFTYDRVELSASLGTRYLGVRVLRFSEVLDVSMVSGPGSTSGTELAISDHYPVVFTLKNGV